MNEPDPAEEQEEVLFEGTQWLMAWQLTPEQRAKARIPEPRPPSGTLPAHWKKELDDLAAELAATRPLPAKKAAAKKAPAKKLAAKKVAATKNAGPRKAK